MAKRVIKNEDGTTTVHLKTPISYKGKDITSITMRDEANIDDVEEMERAGEDRKLDAGIRLAASLSGSGNGPGVHRLAIRAMKMHDILKIISVASKALKIDEDDADDEEGQGEGKKSGPSTGETS